MKKILEKDRQFTCEETAQKAEISHVSVLMILTTKLNMKRVMARWVPHALTTEQKHTRVDVAKQLYKRYESEGEQFINRRVAIDET